jgi:hypothetical protein
VNHQAPSVARGFFSRLLEDFRAQTLRVLKEICPDDPAYIRRWMKAFDKKNGIAIPAIGHDLGERERGPRLGGASPLQPDSRSKIANQRNEIAPPSNHPESKSLSKYLSAMPTDQSTARG